MFISKIVDESLSFVLIQVACRYYQKHVSSSKVKTISLITWRESGPPAQRSVYFDAAFSIYTFQRLLSSAINAVYQTSRILISDAMIMILSNFPVIKKYACRLSTIVVLPNGNFAVLKYMQMHN